MTFVQLQKKPDAAFRGGSGLPLCFISCWGWALMNGLARKVVQTTSAPIETKIIED